MRIVVYDDDIKFLDFIKNSLDKINTRRRNNYMSNVSKKINSFTFIAKKTVNFSDELEAVLLVAHSIVTKKVFLVEDKNYYIPVKYKDILYFEKIKGTKFN